MSAEVVIPEKDLPNWMKRARRGFDWGVLLIIGFSILIAWPFIENPNLPQTNDSIHYAFQASDAAQALQEGRLYMRWSPHALGGLGAPIPHYTPPLPVYVTALIQIFFTNNTVVALRFVHILALIVAGLAVYTLVMQRSNGLAGLLAALLYVYSPYLSLTVPHVLGDLSQAIALALLPMLLWSVNRLLHHNQATDIFVVAVMSAALLLTSPQHVLLGMVLSSILLILHLVENRKGRIVTTLFSAVIIGFGMAAFYWLPAYFEHNLVEWIPVSNFVAPEVLQWDDLLKHTMQLDRGAMLHTPVFNLGWALLLFIAVSIGLIIYRRGSRFHIIWLTMGFIQLLLALFFFPTETWLLGSIVLCLAIGSSILGQQITLWHPLIRYPAIVILIALILGFSLPSWISQSSFSVIKGVTAQDQMAYEIKAQTSALLPDNALYPVTLAPEVVQNRFSNALVNSSNGFRSTGSSQLTLSERGTHFAQYNVFTSVPTTVIYEQSFFAGWWASVDKVRIPVTEESATHLTELALPENIENGVLTIALGTTRWRTLAWILSYCMLGLCIIWVLRHWRTSPDTIDTGILMPPREVWLLIILLLVGLSARMIPIVRDTIYDLRQPPGYQVKNRAFVVNRTQSHLEFQGYNIPQETLIAGEEGSVILYWQAVRESDLLYQVAIQVYHAASETVYYQSEPRPPAYYPTSLWTTNLYIADYHTFQLPPDLPADNYVIRVFLWRCTTKCDEPVNFFRPDRQILGDSISIPITVIEQ